MASQLRREHGMKQKWRYWLFHPIRYIKERGWMEAEDILVEQMQKEIKEAIDEEVIAGSTYTKTNKILTRLMNEWRADEKGRNL